MKHRLPKPKAKTGLDAKTDLEPTELLGGEKMGTSTEPVSAPEASLAKTTLAVDSRLLDSSVHDSLLVTSDQEDSRGTASSADFPAPDKFTGANSKSDDAPFSFLSGPNGAAASNLTKTGRTREIAPIVLRTTNKPKSVGPPPLPDKTLSKKGPPPLPGAKPAPAIVLNPVAQTETPVPLENVVLVPAAKKPVAPQALPLTERTTAPASAISSHLLIQTRGLVKQYGGRRVVNGVDIHVRAGEVVGLLGKNGAGKTTTFYMIVGLVPPNEGHVYMGEEDVTRMPMYRRARRGIGYLPQEESIFRKLTVEENLLAILETLPMTEDERDARCDQLLRDFGLEHVRENVTITLSGGEKRRVTIARALVTSPSLLLLDEPFSGVDPMAVHDIQEIILQLKQRGLGVLITDHNVRETLSVVDRAYIIDEGRVLSEGSREFLLNDPIAREIYLGHRFSM